MAEDGNELRQQEKQKMDEIIEEGTTKEEGDNIKVAQAQQEEKARAKYPFMNPHRDHLKKQIQKGKYFDSGDYAIEKSRLGGKGKFLPSKMAGTSELPTAKLPTADKLPPRKASLQSKLVQS